MDRSWNNDQLGVNKIGKNIKKIPLHQPDFSYGIGIASARPQPRPQVYNIVGENDFRSVVVQQLTPSRDNLAHPQQNTPFRKIRPPALTHDPPRVAAQPTHELLVRPPMQPYMHHGEQLLSKTVESPVSVYMHCLQSSLGDSGPIGNQMQSSHEYQPHSQWKSQAQPHQPPQSHNHHSPRFSGAARDKPILPTPPRFNSPPQQIYNNSLHTPSPRFNGRGILPTPTRGSTFSSMGQPGILGPGSIPQHPASSGLVFPSSPYGLFPNSSPRYR